MPRGKFIVIEGGDGAGKDTQIELLQKEFSGDAFVYTRDPGGTVLGSRLREIVQYDKTVAKETELLLFLASRAQLAHELILPSLAKGLHVISNRFELSTFAYQIYGRQRLELKEFVERASSFARGEAVPDLVVLLDLAPEVGLARAGNRGEVVTRFEQEALDFHTRVREGYLAAAAQFPHVRIVDANRSVEEVFTDVRRAVLEVL